MKDMPRLEQALTVEVKSDATTGEYRQFNLTITGPNHLFILSDLFAREGAIRNIESTLRAAARKATADYIRKGKNFVKGSAKTKKAAMDVK